MTWLTTIGSWLRTPVGVLGVLVLISFIPVWQYDFAALPNTPSHSDDYTIINGPLENVSYAGQLTGYPHTFRVLVEEPGQLTVRLFEPGTKELTQQTALIAVKQERRGVSEVVRHAESADEWSSEYVFFNHVRFYDGGSIAPTLENGDYLVEVSSPDNRAYYHVEFGTGLNARYHTWEFIGLLLAQRHQLNLSPLAVVVSPVVLIMFGVGWGWWRYRRWYRTRYA